MNPAASDLLPLSVQQDAQRHTSDIVALAVEHPAGSPALLVYDRRCALASTLTDAYLACLPQAQAIAFDDTEPAAVLAAFEALPAGALVVLVQSTNFRLDAYRLRVELFKRGLKVIEHLHLARMPGEQAHHYIASLAYDPAYYRGTGRALQQAIDTACGAVVEGGGERLVFGGSLEHAKVNIGDYSGMTNVGGQFPIGEVFTEARDLEAVNGRVRVFVFGDTAFMVNRPASPITLVVERGRVIDALDSTPEFDAVLAQIRLVEGEVWLRELGFGMNRAFSAARTVDDIGTYERMCGIHLSLGAKHGVYTKPQLKRKDARYHIDVFAETDAVYLDGRQVYRDGAWRV
ncbi:MAG TPA: hypothetical protein VIT92_14885 [Burkholderiaceae bacterium]